MKFNPTRHHRRSIRLKGYDYSSAGAYFITLVTSNREHLFGEITAGKIELSEAGLIVAEEWERSAQIRQEIELDEWIVMPNHLHGIVVITTENFGIKTRDDDTTDVLGTGVVVGAHGDVVGAHGDVVGAHGGAPLRRSPRSLGSFIAGFKSAATKRINQLRETPQANVWQRNYYEHIIRDERALERIRQYIANNPANWKADDFNPGLTK